MGNPSKITEGGVEYSLGKFDGKSVVYDFPKILIYKYLTIIKTHYSMSQY